MASSPSRGPPPNNYDNASFLSFLLFLWPGSLIKLGASKTLEQSDLPDVAKDDDVNLLGSRLTKEWKNELESCKAHGRPPSLTRALFRAHGPSNWFVGLILLTESGVRIYQAQILGRLINFLLHSSSDAPLEGIYNDGYFLSFLLVLLGAFTAFLHHHAFFYAWRLGMQLRGALTTLIYDKSVKLSLQSMASISVGHIVNLSAQDVEAFQIAGCFIHFSYTPVLEAMAVLYFGIDLVGVSFVAGFACVIMMIPLQFIFSSQLTKSKGATSKHTDERLKILNQALNGVRLMKINAWEQIFIQIIEGVRKKEVGALLYTNVMRSLNEAIFFALPIMTAAFTFITYNRLGGTLSTSTIFIVMTYFNITQFSIGKFLTMSFASIAECYVAIGRIQRMLMLPEVPDAGGSPAGEDFSIDAIAADKAIVFSNFSASWAAEETSSSTSKVQAGLKGDNSLESIELQQLSPNAAGYAQVESNGNVDAEPASASQGQSTLVLANINLSVAKGELMVIVGSVGCGKSSLLLAALGELPPCPSPIDGTTGHARVSRSATGQRSLAYCSQTPFILSSTVRENIIFSSEFDENWYQECISLCALKEDLASFVHGDATVIGDKGINLSGGQKARVGLCRAMYSNRDTFLLDDPLSAVDTHVGAVLFESICSLVRRGKTVLLATHQVQFLQSPLVSRVVVVDRGSIVGCGSFDELSRSDSIAGYILGHIDDGKKGDDDEDVEELEEAEFDRSREVSAEMTRHRQNSASSTHSQSRAKRAHSIVDGEGKELDTKEAGVVNADAIVDEKEIGGITVDEDKASGSVDLQTYMAYATSMGGRWTGVGLGLLMASAQVLSILANYWLSFWSRAADQQDMYYINTYIGIVIGAVVASILRALLAFSICIHASQRLHNQLLESVINTKILFFDSNPLGRILNRFAKDVAFTDDLLPNTLYDCIQCILMCLGAVLVVCSAVPYIFISLIPLIYFFARLRSYFLQTSREVKRLESLSRSPIFSHLTESLDGVISIRAFDMVPSFQQHNKELLNSNIRGYFAFVAIARWLGFNLDATVVALLLASTFGAVLAKEYNAGINNTAIVVGIMYVIQLTGLFQWAVRQTAEVESLMVSVERILAYSKLEPEGRLHSPSDVGTLGGSADDDANETRARPNWPETGRIDCVDLCASYREDLPDVLHKVSFSLPPGSRVGIVGRSGCGKSTLVSTLLRLVDITGGGLFIDGVDITTIGLHDLRPKISVIQQNPFLFSGTIRQNLDPWGKYADAEIWSALDCVCLKEFVQRYDVGLEHVIEEGGNNFSSGERQLVCLARAILQRNMILVMDEATANIDNDTDMRVQQAIYNEFTKKGCMVLSVAHRLVNIMDFDIILVMSNGILFEWGHPHDLLTKFLPAPAEDGTDKTDVNNEDLIPKASLASLVLQTGPDMSLRLRRMAMSARLNPVPPQ